MVTFLAPEAMGEFQWSRTGLTGLTRKCSDVGVWIIQGVLCKLVWHTLLSEASVESQKYSHNPPPCDMLGMNQTWYVCGRD